MFTKALVVVCCVAAAVLAEEKYTDKYDNINLQEILNNKKLLEAYVHCILDTGKCTPEGKELKSHIKDALETGCSKCTKTQQEGVTTVMDRLISSEKEYWNQLCAKYDPEGVWRKKYEQEAKERGIIIPKE